MANSEVEIYNLALNAVGTEDTVALPTEASREAQVCRLWFGIVRDQVLRAAPWPCAKAYARLAVLAERNDTLAWTNTAPDPGSRFAYATPADMLAPRNLSTLERFKLSVYQGQTAVMTETENAILEYTLSQTNIALWDVQLKMAIVHALAAMIAMPLTGKPGRAKEAQDQANTMIWQARTSQSNTDEGTLETIPDWILARGYAGPITTQRYYYPWGPTIAAVEAYS